MRINQLNILLVMFSSVILLSSSAFFLSSHLTHKLVVNDFSEAQFSYALKNNYTAALSIKEKQSDIGSINWLSLNKRLAKTESDAAFKLGYWFKEQSDKNSEVHNRNITQAVLWFEQAIRLNSPEAIVALSELYYEQGDLLKARSTIIKLSDQIKKMPLVAAALFLRFNIAIDLGEIDIVEQLLNSNKLNKLKQLKQFKQYNKIETYNKLSGLLKDIATYRILPKSNTPSSDSFVTRLAKQNASTCITSLQLFATSIKHLKHLETLIDTFKAEQPLAQFICLPKPLYISKKQLECTAQRSQAISCNESQWQSVEKVVQSRHIGLMLEKGGANVHLGILYFDVEDGANVFSHEVSHLVGFVDEYPLVKNHSICQQTQSKPFSHNIAVLNRYYQGDQQLVREAVLKSIPWAEYIKESTPILSAVSQDEKQKKYWRLGTPLSYKNTVGVYLSESCQETTATVDLSTSQFLTGDFKTLLTNSKNSKIELTPLDFTRHSAFKPLKSITQLRYYVKDFPQEYLDMLASNPSKYLMPSFHYNVALALFQQGKVIDAKNWLNKASQWEINPARKKVIITGAF